MDDHICFNCKHRMFSDCYMECQKGYKGIVWYDDTCEHFEPRTIDNRDEK